MFTINIYIRKINIYYVFNKKIGSVCLKDKVITYIRKNKLIEPGDNVLVALSGGPDSVCLLDILYKLKDKLNITLGAVHINHMLRGEDSDKDEEYVIELCNKIGIQSYIKRVDINAYSAENKMSSEMAGRKVRYDFFEEVMKNGKYNKIATAHNANDQAETIIFRLIRGSGLEGLGGIKAYRDNKIIRPILCLDREEVEEYIRKENLNPRIDKTNFEKIYNRNKIRLDILPYIKEYFNEDIIKTLNRTAGLLQKDNEFLESESLKVYQKYCIEYDKYFIIKKDAFTNHDSIISRMLRNALIRYSNQTYDFEMKHIYEIMDLARKDTGKIVNLPKNIFVENIYGDIYIKNKLNQKKVDSKKIRLNKLDIDNKKIDFQDFFIQFTVMKNDKNINLKENEFIKYFEFDKIEDEILLKTREDGDRMIPLGMKGNKKVKDIFIDMKVPKDLRDLIPILCFDSRIAWVIGARTSEEYRISNNSKNILKVIVSRKEH